MAYLDRRVVRKRTGGWTRQLSLQVPAYEYRQFHRAAAEALTDAACFLTGDRWSFEIVARKGPTPTPQHAAGLTLPPGENAFDVYATEDVVDDWNGRKRRMTPGERAIAVRAVSAMAELARLSDLSEGELAVRREARLIDSKNPRVVKAKFLGLLHQHRAEWDAFIGSLPNRSWVGEIVGQL